MVFFFGKRLTAGTSQLAGLRDFFDRSRPDAAGADLDPLVFSFNQRSHGLEVRENYPFCPVICMTDIVSDRSVFTAH